MLRLWVASVNYAADVCIGGGIIKQNFETCAEIAVDNRLSARWAYDGGHFSPRYRKLRNTARYILGNLHDFDPAAHTVPYEQLPALDRYILGRTAQFAREVRAEI